MEVGLGSGEGSEGRLETYALQFACSVYWPKLPHNVMTMLQFASHEGMGGDSGDTPDPLGSHWLCPRTLPVDKNRVMYESWAKEKGKGCVESDGEEVAVPRKWW